MTKTVIDLNGWTSTELFAPPIGKAIWLWMNGQEIETLIVKKGDKLQKPSFWKLIEEVPEPPVIREMTPKEEMLNHFNCIYTTLQEKYSLKEFYRLEDTLEYFNKYYCDTLPVPAFSYLEGGDINELCVVMSWSSGLQVIFKPLFSSRSRVLLNNVALSIELDLTKAYGWKCLNDLITLREMK